MHMKGFTKGLPLISRIWNHVLHMEWCIRQSNSLMTVAHRKITLLCGFFTAYDLVMYKSTADGKIFYKMLVLVR